MSMDPNHVFFYNKSVKSLYLAWRRTIRRLNIYAYNKDFSANLYYILETKMLIGVYLVLC